MYVQLYCINYVLYNMIYQIAYKNKNYYKIHISLLTKKQYLVPCIALFFIHYSLKLKIMLICKHATYNIFLLKIKSIFF